MMKKTVSSKIVLWYGISVIIILLVCGVVLQRTENQMTDNLIEERLHNAVDMLQLGEAADSDDESDFSDYIDGIQIIIYDGEGEVISGDIPEIVEDIAFEDGNFSKTKADDTTYYVYDEQVDKNVSESFMVRACFAFESGTIKNMSRSRSLLVLIPLLLILTLAGGFIISKRAMAPVRKMRVTAEEIAQSSDLHRRIELNSRSENELTMLADTFNEMFDRIEELFEQEKQLTRDASHELRTPVSVILAQAEYLEDELRDCDESEMSDEMKSSVDVILRQSKRMKKLVNDLLMVSRIESQNYAVETGPVDVSELMSVVAEEMQDLAEEKHIKISTHIDPDLKIESNEPMIIRAVMNLLSNAIKYGKYGGNIMLRAQKDGSGVCLSVKDDGIGIDSKEIDKIWNRFYTVNSSKDSGEENTGLGLFLVKCIVESLGGSITVESTINVGSCFTINLPEKYKK